MRLRSDSRNYVERSHNHTNDIKRFKTKRVVTHLRHDSSTVPDSRKVTSPKLVPGVKKVKKPTVVYNNYGLPRKKEEK